MIEWIDKAVKAFYAQSVDLKLDKGNEKLPQDYTKSCYLAMKKRLKDKKE